MYKNISCDASTTGLGDVLLQENCPVAYASRSLSDAESRYAQIRKGTLGISAQPEAIQTIRVWKESACRIRSQPPRNNCEEAISDSTTQTTEISAQNANVRLNSRV